MTVFKSMLISLRTWRILSFITVHSTINKFLVDIFFDSDVLIEEFWRPDVY